MIIVTFLIVLVILYLLTSFAVRRGLQNLSCQRAFSAPAFFPGDEGELVEVVRNDSPAVIPWLMIESQVSPHLRLGSKDNLHVSGDTHYCSQFTLMPYQQIRRRHRVRFLHRGSYNLGNASLTAGNIFGGQCQRTQQLDCPVLVYPALMDAEDLPLPISSQLQEISRRPQLLRDPFLVRGLRAYQPGDPVRDIHWPATARMGDAQVRVHDYAARTRLLVVLNCQLHEKQFHDHLADEDGEKIEYGISLAATVCIQALRQGMDVGFCVNMSQEGETTPTCILPAAGSVREEELLNAFARLKLLRTRNFLSLLEDLTAQSDLDILILSLYDSEDIQSRMEDMRRSGNQVVLHLLEGGQS